MASEISDSDSITVEDKPSNTTTIVPSNTITPNNLTKELQDVLTLLIDDHSILAINYALAETIRLMETWFGLSHEEIEDNKVMTTNFVSQASKNLMTYPYDHYDNSTRAQLELFLHAVSSVLHVLSSNVDKIRKEVRDPLYKSVSDFWTTYRRSGIINANIVFSLREIRNCLRKIKDDQPSTGVLVKHGGNLIDTVISLAQKEYFAAIGSLVKLLDFEYVTGEWYYYWTKRREEYYKLRRKCMDDDSELKNMKKFYGKLCKLSDKEFARVQRKNTKYCNLEYKLLKSGGAAAKCSLPDHIDTLLIGYLRLMQLILEEPKFFPIVENKHINKTITLCSDIVDTHVKKLLTFKGVEVLYVIRILSSNEVIKNEITSKFDTWYSIIPTASRSYSVSSFSSSQLITPPGTPMSSQFPSDSPSTSGRMKLTRRESFKKITKKMKIKRPVSYKDVIDDVVELFNERNKIYKNIYETKLEYDKLSNDENVDENLILEKFLEELKRWEKEKREFEEEVRKLKEEKRKLEEMIICEEERKLEEKTSRF